MTVDNDLDHLAEAEFVRFLRFPSFHAAYFGKKIITCSSHLRSGELCSPPFRAEFLHKLLGILLHGQVFLLPLLLYSIICLYQYELVDIYFILYTLCNDLIEVITIVLLLLLRFFQLGPVDVLSVGSCAPWKFVSTWSCCFVSLFGRFFFSTVLLSGPTTCSRLILCISCPSPGISHFYKEPGSFSWRRCEKPRSGHKVWLFPGVWFAAFCISNPQFSRMYADDVGYNIFIFIFILLL